MIDNFTVLESGPTFAEFTCADTGERVSVELKPDEILQQDVNGGFRVISLGALSKLNPQTDHLNGVITSYTVNNGDGAEVYNLVGDCWVLAGH